MFKTSAANSSIHCVEFDANTDAAKRGRLLRMNKDTSAWPSRLGSIKLLCLIILNSNNKEKKTRDVDVFINFLLKLRRIKLIGE